MVKIKTIKLDDENTFSEKLENLLNKGWELLGEIQIKEEKKQSIANYGDYQHGILTEYKIIFIATLKKVLTQEEEHNEIEKETLIDAERKLKHCREWNELVKNPYIEDDLIINRIAQDSQVDKSLIIKLLQIIKDESN